MTTTPPQSLPPDLVPAGVGAPRPDRRPPTQSRFQAFVDSVFDAYYDWHIHTGYMEFSAQMDTLLGLAPEALPRAFAAWLARLHPDDRAATVETVRTAVREGGVYRDEYRLRREDGSYVHVRDRGVVLRDEDGRSSHMVGAIRDVTRDLEAERALHEAAELYRTLFENAVNSAFQIAHDGRFLDANAAGTSFMGMSRGQLLRRDVGGLWGADALEAVRETTTSGVTASLELELEVGEAVKALAVTLVPCRFRGEATCFALGTDITEHRNLRTALEESEASLRLQAQALSDANIALRVILEQRNRDRSELERTISDNVDTVILPMLGRLAKPLAATPEAIYLDAALQSLREVVSPLAQALSSPAEAGLQLTPREREIASLIRVGRSTSEIAEALYISPTTVSFHRKNLRRKLGLGAGGPRLASHLGQSRA
jgi:PAS domain S-box-containing protein